MNAAVSSDVSSLFAGHLRDLRAWRALAVRHLENHRDDLGPIVARRIARAIELVEQAEFGLDVTR